MTYATQHENLRSGSSRPVFPDTLEVTRRAEQLRAQEIAQFAARLRSRLFSPRVKPTPSTENDPRHADGLPRAA